MALWPRPGGTGFELSQSEHWNGGEKKTCPFITLQHASLRNNAASRALGKEKRGKRRGKKKGNEMANVSVHTHGQHVERNLCASFFPN